MMRNYIVLKVRLAVWFYPYVWLTRFGCWLGLPINMDRVVADLLRGIQIKVHG